MITPLGGNMNTTIPHFVDPKVVGPEMGLNAAEMRLVVDAETFVTGSDAEWSDEDRAALDALREAGL
jgi:hypothetical protein